MNKQFLLFLSAVVALCLAQCKQECTDSTNPDCPNYCPPVVTADPCIGAEETSANFLLFQLLPVENALDTLIEFYYRAITGASITLHAQQNSAQYHWIIGSDDYFTQDVTFSIGSQFAGQNIELKLVVERTPNTTCFPNDNGVDTLVKTIVVFDNCDASIWGHYYGAWEDLPSDSFEMAFVFEDAAPGDCYPVMVVGAKPNLPDSCAGSSCYYVDNYMTFTGIATACHNPSGWAKLDSTLNNILIDYSISVTSTWNEPREYHVFHGHRIN